MRVRRAALGRTVGRAEAPAGRRSEVAPACHNLSTHWKVSPFGGVPRAVSPSEYAPKGTRAANPQDPSRAAQGNRSRLRPSRSRALHPGFFCTGFVGQADRHRLATSRDANMSELSIVDLILLVVALVDVRLVTTNGTR